MARIVIRCQYTGHYVFTGFDTQTAPAVAGGRIFCPYCVAEHVWSAPKRGSTIRARAAAEAAGPPGKLNSHDAFHMTSSRSKLRRLWKFRRIFVRNGSQFPASIGPG